MSSALRVPVDQLRVGSFELNEATSRYVARVHRRAVGDLLELFEPTQGTKAIARITSIDQGHVLVDVTEVQRSSARGAREIVIVQCLAKGEKMDSIVRDATELGATRFVPAESERSIVRLVKQADRAAERSQRWRRISVEASRQCGRDEALSVDEPATLVDVLTSLEADLKLILLPTGETLLRELLPRAEALASIAFVVGPEGGLSHEEATLAIEHGWVSTRLGPLTLRTETVAAAVLGTLMVCLASETSER
ncbi:MAG: RsmE family RNA methyltransferase [Polyangiaceae bacterium]